MKKMRKKTNNSFLYIPQDVTLTLRTSLIKQYLRCPAQCFFRYFKGLVILPRSYTTMGYCFHKSAEHHYVYKKKKGKDTKLSVLQDVFHETFKERKPMTQWTKEEKPEELEKEGVKSILPEYYKARAIVLEPKYVEEKFELKLPEVNTILTGTIDLTLTNDEIRDHKLKSRMPNWMEPYKSTQGFSYTLGYKNKFGKAPKGFSLDYILRRSKGTEVETSKMVKHSQQELDNFLSIVTQVVESIRKGIFFPRKENNFLCSPTMCGFWPICKQGQWKNLGVFTQVFGSNQGAEEEEE